ncbi:MAG: RnfABCDGE type electron transport complex subunit D, partial [Bacteroidales bacterium]|nr:RnfABCDGE type electron transport complex subunit D [Bacteroidales bacterium]
VAACVIFEWLIMKYIIKGTPTVTDISAVVTGILLAFNVPTSLPTWILVLGALVAIGMGKMTFGGLGKNPFNPALVGRVFLLISWPVDMTTWPSPKPLFNLPSVDALTGPTPLGVVKEGISAGQTVEQAMANIPSYSDGLLNNFGEYLTGYMAGSMGEVSAVLLLLGGLYMLIRKVIFWHIPVAYIGSVVIFTGILQYINPDTYVGPLFHIATGGLILGAFYMATDMVTSPMSAKGMIVFGLGCGVITVIIRVFGAYPEGVSFAILIMNAFVPLINRSMKPKRFGEVIKHG